MITPTFELFSEKAKEGNLIPVYREILADTETPVSAFLKIKEGQYSYLLESVEGGEKWGRYSFLGTSPSVIIKGAGNSVEIQEGDDCQRLHNENPLQVLKSVMARFKPVKMEGLERFAGGAVGFIGYEGMRFFESMAFKNTQKGTDFFFMFTDTFLIFDNLKHKIKIVTNAFIENSDLKQAYQKAVAKIDATVARFEAPLKKTHCLLSADENKNAPITSPSSNMSKEQFIESVHKALAFIRAGDVFQVQLSQRFSIPIKSDPFVTYRALRSINPSPYMYYIQAGSLHLVGTSPEVLVRLEGSRAEVRPIAGTRRRGGTVKEDLALEKELLADHKERAEHIMLVDLGRNDLGRVCDYGSVQVTELMVIERYSHVMHIVSNVVGKLRDTSDAFSLLEACFPAGTVTGAPKIRAMKVIDALEPSGRGLYAGTVGYFGFDGNMDTCITIRTIVVENNVATVQAAAGIVADSDPNSEYEETMNKAKAMLSAIAMAEGGLT
jgi:anthranilate synthase component 1